MMNSDETLPGGLGAGRMPANDHPQSNILKS